MLILLLLFSNCRKEDVNELVRFDKTQTVERFLNYLQGGDGGSNGGGGGGIPPGIDSPYWPANWYDYGAGYPNPYDPNSPNYYYPPGFFYDPGNPYYPFYPWFGGGGGGYAPVNDFRPVGISIIRDISILNNPKMTCILDRLEGYNSSGQDDKLTKYDELLSAFKESNIWNLTYKLEAMQNGSKDFQL
jgi:hypothetical protein